MPELFLRGIACLAPSESEEHSPPDSHSTNPLATISLRSASAPAPKKSPDRTARSLSRLMGALRRARRAAEHHAARLAAPVTAHGTKAACTKATAALTPWSCSGEHRRGGGGARGRPACARSIAASRDCHVRGAATVTVEGPSKRRECHPAQAWMVKHTARIGYARRVFDVVLRRLLRDDLRGARGRSDDQLMRESLPTATGLRPSRDAGGRSKHFSQRDEGGPRLWCAARPASCLPLSYESETGASFFRPRRLAELSR